jgi:hemoglobin-like flavoprotein
MRVNQSKKFLLSLGKFHHHAGIPADYFGVMGTIFLHAVEPYLREAECWNEATEDAWMAIFGHIARVMTHGHQYYHIYTDLDPPT